MNIRIENKVSRGKEGAQSCARERGQGDQKNACAVPKLTQLQTARIKKMKRNISQGNVIIVCANWQLSERKTEKIERGGSWTKTLTGVQHGEVKIKDCGRQPVGTPE